MAWNPQTYHRFKTERAASFYDALGLVRPKPEMEILDMGCGTGELTHELAEAFPDARVLGIDSSAEMLRDTGAFSNDRLHFERRTIEEQLDLPQRWDVVFSNAAIQWVQEHPVVFPRIIHMLKPGGQLVLQMPAQHHNAANRILDQLAAEEPFRKAMGNFIRTSPVLETDAYAGLLFENDGTDITVFEKIYPLVTHNWEGVFEFISGTGLVPYMERLAGDEKERFLAEYKRRLQHQFPGSPVFYPFKRILLSAVF